MEAPYLPPIGSTLDAAAPIRDATNPGCVDVASQGSPRMSVDQTRSRTTSSASAVSSNGEIQTVSGNTIQGTVTVTEGHVPTIQLSGDSGQRKDLRAAEPGASPLGSGLVREVNPADAAPGRHPGAAEVACHPTARNVNAGISRPGGLPANVNVR